MSLPFVSLIQSSIVFQQVIHFLSLVIFDSIRCPTRCQAKVFTLSYQSKSFGEILTIDSFQTFLLINDKFNLILVLGWFQRWKWDRKLRIQALLSNPVHT